jgi:hypothetical protein
VPQPVDELRAQLRERGYLTHGIDRWFALDPWSSRTFWLELVTVALKAAVLLSAFGILPPVAIMLFRNHPLSAGETLLLALLYGTAWLVTGFALIVAMALAMKLRPELAIDTPGALLGIAMAAAALLTSPIALWWSRFDAPPPLAELAAGLALTVLFFLFATLIVSAAMLSFSVYELQRIPAIHSRPRTVPMTVAAVVLMALLFRPAYAAQEQPAPAPPVQVVTTPVMRRVALVAADGLTWKIFTSRPELGRALPHHNPTMPIAAESATERWATVGTGVPPRVHGVRAIEGVRFRGGRHVLQTLSRADFVLRDLASAAGIVRREPLPPTVRRRDYVWEIFAARGLTAVAVNWWTTETRHAGALDSIGQETIFAAARGDAVAVDRIASARLLAAAQRDHPQFATVYLPALDIVLNRLVLDPSTRLAGSVAALDGLAETIASLRAEGFEVVLAGIPGEGAAGQAVIAATFPLSGNARLADLAPTLAALVGFPASNEMMGRSLIGERPRIATYGNRAGTSAPEKVDEDYYRNLKSLGYIR